MHLSQVSTENDVFKQLQASGFGEFSQETGEKLPYLGMCPIRENKLPFWWSAHHLNPGKSCVFFPCVEVNKVPSQCHFSQQTPFLQQIKNRPVSLLYSCQTAASWAFTCDRRLNLCRPPPGVKHKPASDRSLICCHSTVYLSAVSVRV